MKHTNIILAVLALFALAGCVSTYQSPAANSEGRVVFTMTDAAADIGNITSIDVTIDGVKVLNAAGVWTTVSTEQQTYDLLALKASGNHVLLADYNLTPGTYNQVRLDISRVVITDDNGEHTAKLPSGVLKLVGTIIVNANSTSAVEFDFIADESVHMTGNGLYIFAPVIQLETREKVDVDADVEANVRISGGRLVDNRKEGMDLDGNIGEGLRIKKDAKLSINGNKLTEELGIT